MSEQGAPIQEMLSILDSIRPDAAAKVRAAMAHNPNAIHYTKGTSLLHAVGTCLVWHRIPAKADFWAQVDREYKQYVRTWFGTD